MNDIRVTRDTTIDQLEQFAQDVSDNAKIRGKRNDDGSITLYASTKRGTGLKNLFFKTRAQRQDAARSAIAMVLSGVKAKPGLFAAKKLDPIQLATFNVLMQFPETGEVKGERLKQLVADAAKARHKAQSEVDARESHLAFKSEIRTKEKGVSDGFTRVKQSLNDAIGKFDRSKLKPTTTVEKSGLAQAKDLMAIDSLIDELSQGTDPAEFKSPGHVLKTPSMSQLSGSAVINNKFATMGTRLKDAIAANDQATIKSLATELGDLLAQDLRWTPRDTQLGFAASRGEEFKNELLHALAQKTGSPGPLKGDYADASADVKAFLDAAYDRAVTNLSDRKVDDKTIVIDGKTYTHSKLLGRGAYGRADLYEASTGEKIVIKTPEFQGMTEFFSETEEQEALFDAAASELKAHRSAQGDGHPNIVGLKGAIRTADGKLLIAMEFAARGELRHLLTSLDEAVKKGEISQHAATLTRITILQDMLKGMQHAHENRGVTHFDLKPGNYFLTADGKAVVGDFGLGDAALNRKFTKSPVDNPRWVAPEMWIGHEKLKGLVQELTKHHEEVYNRAVEANAKALAEFKPLLKPRFYKQLVELTEKDNSKLREALEQGEKDFTKDHAFELTEKADVFSLGVSAYELFYGKVPIEAKFQTQIIEQLTQFGSDYNNRRMGLGMDTDGNRTGMGVTALDRLLNAMMHPDPAQRPSLSQALASSLFTESGVDSVEVRDLIRALTDQPRDVDAIKKASEKIGV